MFSGIAISSVVALVAFTSRVNAHGFVDQPKPTWKDGPNVEWVVNIDNYWDIGSGGDQVGKFKTMAKEKGMSVRDVALDMVKDKKCGNTLENGVPQPIPSDGNVMWLGNGGGGFTHQGPCEVYIDDKLVLHGDNCEEEFPGGEKTAAPLPVDFSSCNGKCLLTFYWIAFQNANWQAYVNCVPLEGSGGSATQTQGSQSSPKPADALIKQESMDQENGKSPAPEEQKRDQEQQQNQAPSPQPGKQDQKKEEDQKKIEEQNKKDEGQVNQSPSMIHDQQKQQEEEKKKKEEEQKKQQNQQQNQPPSPQQNQQDQQKQQEDQKKQEEEQKKQQGQQQNQPPSPQQDQQKQQEDQKKQQEEQQKQQDQQQPQQQQQSDQPPSTEQRSMDFTNLNGGTGTVQPARNLRK
ncbi:hypothetical protein PHMEG_0002479 [Phytophthora megakarya]|uniref:Uncharacterized protein n=1 Tax=Phytophthora megakarya TaxID=4795 RepID=A0A225WYL3_9STRA|nr:hypothetical protein PHMEG_0002479 [Phytophthora megakarya]